MERVGFGSRLVAYLIDTLIVIILAFLLSGVVASILGVEAAGAAQGGDAEAAMGFVAGLMVALAVGLPVLSTLYFLVEGFTGWTLGKLILGLKIGSAAGGSASMGTLLARWAVKNIGTILSFLAMIVGVPFLGTVGSIAGLVILVGCFFVLGEKRQAFHDLAAKTAVYKRAQLSG